MRPIITLLTDFGEGSPYVAQMKAVILSIAPQVQLVDITHSIEPQDVRQAAVVLSDVAPHFPAETIHVCVVDPGVGTQRKLLYARIAGQHYLAPDNGLLSRLARRFPPAEIRSIDARSLYRPVLSATFHGRDIFAPVAAHLSQGLDPRELGPHYGEAIELSWPVVVSEPGRIAGGVEWIDRFGNLITNIDRAQLPAELAVELAVSPLHIACCGRDRIRLVRTYGEAEPQTVVALLGSNDRLEIAVVQGNARLQLGAVVGTPVSITWG